MQTLHTYWAYVVVVANLAVGVVGLVAYRRARPVTRPYWIALAFAWASIYVQGALGLALFERHQPPFKHHFYGFLFALITLAVFPLKGPDPRRTLLVFAVATLFIGIVAVRATLSL